MNTPNPLCIADARLKIKVFDEACLQALKAPSSFEIPPQPARDLVVVHPKFHPPKLGFSSVEGRARIIHDLANIELQAMELAFRSLVEYPEALHEFREQMCDLARSEARHFHLCLETLEQLGFSWGHWPGHLCLWEAVSREDTLLERIVLVHRFLEGSGLDAGATLLRRLEGGHDRLVLETVQTITAEELDHVQFGSRWFHDLCKAERLDSNHEFRRCVRKLIHQLPKRIEPVNVELRRKALFSESEVSTCQKLRNYFMTPKDLRSLDLI